ALDVVGGIGLAAVIGLRERIEHREETVETDGRAIERRKINVTHGLFSCRATWFCVWPHAENPFWRLPAASDPVIGGRSNDLGSGLHDFKPSPAPKHECQMNRRFGSGSAPSA